MFITEKELVDFSMPLIERHFKPEKVVIEPEGLFGIPDVMIYNGIIISFEFKLKNWKRALQQAFRYKSFSSLSYVFIEKKHLNPPLKNIELFEKTGIGLCTYNNDEIEFIYTPQISEPFSDRLTKKACNIISET